MKKERCTSCGGIKAVAVRNDNGATCHNCYKKQNTEACLICGKSKAVAARNGEGKAICDNCNKELNKANCCVCHGLKQVRARSANNEPMCLACHRMVDLKQFFSSYRRGAGRRGHAFELTLEEFERLVRQPCWYCGRYNRGGLFSGVDRIDSSLGYALENTLPCCGECNMMKGSMSQQGFKAKIIHMAAHLESK